MTRSNSKFIFLHRLFFLSCITIFVIGILLSATLKSVYAVTLADPAAALDGVVSSNNGQGLNVRSSPGTNSGIIGHLANGAKVQVIGKDSSGDWYQLKVDGVTGEAWD